MSKIRHWIRWYAANMYAYWLMASGWDAADYEKAWNDGYERGYREATADNACSQEAAKVRRRG